MTNKSLKILSVNTSDTSGGAARAAKRIHDGINLLDSGAQSMMFVKYKYSVDPTVHSLDEFIPDNIVYKACDWLSQKFQNKVQHYRWNKFPKRENVFMSDMRGTFLHDALHKFDYDVLHLHWINQRFLNLSDLLLVRKPIVWTLHDSWPFCGVCHYFLDCEGYKHQCGCCPFLHSDDKNDLSHRVWKLKSKIIKQLDMHIVTPSKWLGECAKSSSLFGGFPVTVIPNCLDTEVFRPLSKNEYSLQWRSFIEKRCKRHFVLYGAMNAATDKIKGFSNLLSALKILDRQKKTGFELIVFGADKSDLKIDISVPIHFVGMINNTKHLVELYNIADVTVVPSWTENLSCTIMESLSCETPVCCYNIGGNSDMVVHKHNGYLAEGMNDVDLANGIDWCLKNNYENLLGKHGREFIKREFSIRPVCNRYMELYKAII